MPHHQCRGDRKLCAEFGLQARLRHVVAQHGCLGWPDGDPYAADLRNLKVLPLGNGQHAINHAVAGIAHRVTLDRQAKRQNAQRFTQLVRRARAVYPARRRQRIQVTCRVLKHIGRSRHAKFCQAHGFYAAGRCAARMKRLGHGAEISHQPAGHAGCNRQRVACLRLRQTVQISHGSSSGYAAKNAGGVPALQVVLIRLSGKQFGPDLIAHHIGTQCLKARNIQQMAFGQDGRHQHRAGVRRHGHIVKIKRMRRDTVDAGGLCGWQHGTCKRHHRCLSRQVADAGIAQLRLHDAHHTLLLARQHRGQGVHEAGFGDSASRLLITGQRRFSHKRSQRLGQRLSQL